MVVGWALDVGSRVDMGGVAYVQLLLDGVIISDTNEGSFYWEPVEWDFNYYGHPRMDIHNLYVDVPNSKHSGFSFLMDISELILNRGIQPGYAPAQGEGRRSGEQHRRYRSVAGGIRLQRRRG